MSEQFATVGDVELCYQTFGDPSDPAVLLVMGLGTQMVAWHEDFCGQVAARGFHVIRFDNRDVGHSTRFNEVPPPTPGQLVTRRVRPAYLLSDMAGDAAGLLDVLGIESAHVVGASMGGMIAQTMALEHPARVRSLVSIMSNTGNRWLGQPAPQIYPLLLRRLPADREGYIRAAARLFRVIGSPGLSEQDVQDMRELMTQSFDRGMSAAGTGRQLAAIIASGDRTRRLRNVKVPTLVIHGTVDKLVRPSGGRATARAIPGATLMRIDGMGHDLPRFAWPQIIDGIAATAERAGEPAGDRDGVPADARG
jgi:pimeloyl-ACP methyl ester carboxylesterase